MGSGRLWLFGNNHGKIVHGTKPSKTQEKTAKNGDFPRFLMTEQGCVVNTVRFAAGTPPTTPKCLLNGMAFRGFSYVFKREKRLAAKQDYPKKFSKGKNATLDF